MGNFTFTFTTFENRLTSAILTGMFRAFPQKLQANVWTAF
jgi:hypothetical protein